MSTSTRERILDAAIELFAQQGYKGTSVAQIEKASGLAPGSGSLYHHFPTKQAVLTAGLQRHLARSRALRDIRAILVDLGSLRAELTILARFILIELDAEAELLRLILTEARHQPEALEPIVDQVIDAAYTGFAEWLVERTGISDERARTAATLGLGALVSSRLVPLLLGKRPVETNDLDLVRGWVTMMESQLSTPVAPAPGNET